MNYIGSVGRQNNNPKFQGRHIKNENIDHGVKENCDIMSIEVIYETDQSLYSVIQQCRMH